MNTTDTIIPFVKEEPQTTTPISSTLSSSEMEELNRLRTENKVLQQQLFNERSKACYFRSVNSKLLEINLELTQALQEKEKENDEQKDQARIRPKVVESDQSFLPSDSSFHQPWPLPPHTINLDYSQHFSTPKIEYSTPTLALEAPSSAPSSHSILTQLNKLVGNRPRIDMAHEMGSAFWRVPVGCKFSSQCYATATQIKPVFIGPKGGLFFWQDNNKKRYVKAGDPHLVNHHLLEMEKFLGPGADDDDSYERKY